eukprot:6174615-Pleurochrysis_carterae.AAC.2
MCAARTCAACVCAASACKSSYACVACACAGCDACACVASEGDACVHATMLVLAQCARVKRARASVPMQATRVHAIRVYATRAHVIRALSMRATDESCSEPETDESWIRYRRQMRALSSFICPKVAGFDHAVRQMGQMKASRARDFGQSPPFRAALTSAFESPAPISTFEFPLIPDAKQALAPGHLSTKR